MNVKHEKFSITLPDWHFTQSVILYTFKDSYFLKYTRKDKIIKVLYFQDYVEN